MRCMGTEMKDEGNHRHLGATSPSATWQLVLVLENGGEGCRLSGCSCNACGRRDERRHG
jgi:hypothetical protein